MQPTELTSRPYPGETENPGSLGLRKAMKLLRRRARFIAILCLLATVAGYGFSKVQKKQYTATASLVFTSQSVAQQASGEPASVQTDPQGQRDTNLELLQLSSSVANATARSLDGRLSAKQVKASVTASEQGPADSNVLSVSAKSTSPELAARIANTFTAQFIKQQTANNQSTIQGAIDMVDGQYAALSKADRATPQGQSLIDHIESLKILRSMQNTTQLVQPASVPTAPSSPKIIRNTVLGAILGLLFGLGFALLLEQLDQRLREPSDAEDAYGLPTVGVIPHGRPTDAGLRNALRVAELEPFRMLRAHLRYFNVDRELRTLMVTSANPGEGKTTIASSLAIAAANMGTRTLLIEADLRKPRLERALGLRPGPGLAGALVGEAPLGEAIQSVAMESGIEGGEGVRALDVLEAGAVPPNPAELLESRTMVDLLEWAREQYQLVIIDTSPVAVVADAIPMMKVVDGVLVVARVGRTTRTAAQHLRERLENLGAPAFGLVVNDVRASSGEYGYGYGYAYGTVEARSADRQTPVFANVSTNGAESVGAGEAHRESSGSSD